jgi:hypothetical protein
MRTPSISPSLSLLPISAGLLLLVAAPLDANAAGPKATKVCARHSHILKRAHCLRCARMGGRYREADNRCVAKKSSRGVRAGEPIVLRSVLDCQTYEKKSVKRRLKCVKCARKKGTFMRKINYCTNVPRKATKTKTTKTKTSTRKVATRKVAARRVVGRKVAARGVAKPKAAKPRVGAECAKYSRIVQRARCMQCARFGGRYRAADGKCMSKKKAARGPRAGEPIVLKSVRACQTYEKKSAKRRLKCVKCARKKGRYLRNINTCTGARR